MSPIYTPAEWFQHMEAFCTASRELPPIETRERMAALFREQYPDSNEATEKHARFVAAVSYLDQHMEAFDTGEWAVAGNSVGMVSRYIMIALYRFFTHAPLDDIPTPPPPDVFLNVAKEHKDNERNA